MLDFSFDEYVLSFPIFLIGLVDPIFYWILEWFVPWDHLLGKFFQPFTLRKCLTFTLRYISCMQQNAGSCLCTHSISLCLYIRELRPLMWKNIMCPWLLLTVIFLLRGGIMFVWFSSFGFVVRRLMSCFFLGVVSLFVLEFSF